MAQAVVIGIMLLQGMHIGKPVDGGAVLAGCYEFPADTACRGWVGDGQELNSALDLVDGMILPAVFYPFFTLVLSPCVQGGDGFLWQEDFPNTGGCLGQSEVADFALLVQLAANKDSTAHKVNVLPCQPQGFTDAQSGIDAKNKRYMESVRYGVVGEQGLNFC